MPTHFIISFHSDNLCVAFEPPVAVCITEIRPKTVIRIINFRKMLLNGTHSESYEVKVDIPNSFKFSYSCFIATDPPPEFPNSNFGTTRGSRGTIPSSLLPCLNLCSASPTFSAKHSPSFGSNFRHFWISGAVNLKYFEIRKNRFGTYVNFC